MPVASSDANADVNGITWQQVVRLYLISIVFKVRNAVVPLMILLACVTLMASANGIIITKKSCPTLFELSSPKECSGAILMPVASCDFNTSASVAAYFDYLDLTNAVVP